LSITIPVPSGILPGKISKFWLGAPTLVFYFYGHFKDILKISCYLIPYFEKLNKIKGVETIANKVKFSTGMA